MQCYKEESTEILIHWEEGGGGESIGPCETPHKLYAVTPLAIDKWAGSTPDGARTHSSRAAYCLGSSSDAS